MPPSVLNNHRDRLHASAPAGSVKRAPTVAEYGGARGNPNMVDACFEALKGHGLPVPQIRREKYVSNK